MEFPWARRTRRRRDAPLAVPPPTPRQRAHLEDLARRVRLRTPASLERAKVSHSVLADSRNVSRSWLVPREEQGTLQALRYPLVGERSRGSRIFDLDGNEYVDFSMGFGVHLFGHAPPFLTRAVQRQLELGAQIGPQAERAYEVASRICQLAGVERVAFCNTGTEAVMFALRLARAATGRSKVALFRSSYHGSSDAVLGAIPSTLGVASGVGQDVLLLRYGSDGALRKLRRRARELAAVLVEPVQSERPDFQPTGFLRELRALTERLGIALVFDEVMTGFRVHPGGAQAWFGVRADLVTYGKVVGGGLPIGVIGGRAPYMDLIDRSESERIWYAGTFNKNPLSLAGAAAVLERLEGEGPDLQRTLNRRTQELAEELDGYFAARGVAMRVARFGSIFRFREDPPGDVLRYHLLDKGIHASAPGPCFLSTAHSPQDVARLVRAVEASVDELQAAGFLSAAQPAPRA